MRNKKDILFWCELNTFSGEKNGKVNMAKLNRKWFRDLYGQSENIGG
jgi:hypothetical protein